MVRFLMVITLLTTFQASFGETQLDQIAGQMGIISSPGPTSKSGGETTKVIVLILVFQDGYLGGHTTAAYFHDKPKCEKFGTRLALQYNGYGHPTSYMCAPTTLPKDKAKIVR